MNIGIGIQFLSASKEYFFLLDHLHKKKTQLNPPKNTQTKQTKQQQQRTIISFL